MADTLPDCMAPDGAEPCAAFLAKDAENERLLAQINEQRQDAATRALNIRDERIDDRVKALCELYGYGAIMDSAARQWAIKDSRGAFYIGGCLSVSDLGLAATGNLTQLERSNAR